MQADTITLCTNLWLRMYRCLDTRDYDGLLATLGEEVVWLRQGQRLEGRAAVREALARRSPTMRIHHLLTNVMARDGDDRRCRLAAYMLVLRHEPGQELAGPAPLAGIESVRGTYADFAWRDGQWRITGLHSDDISFQA